MKLNKRTLEIIKRKVLAYLLITVMIAGVVTPLSYASANQASQTQETEMQESGTDADDLTEVGEDGDSEEVDGDAEESVDTNAQADDSTNDQNGDVNSGTTADSVRAKWEAIDWANFIDEFDWYGLDEDTWNVVLDVLAAKLSAGEIDSALMDKIQQSGRAYLDGKNAPIIKVRKARMLGAPAGGVDWSTFDWSSITDMTAFEWNAVDWSKVDFDSFDDATWDMVYAAIEADLLDEDNLDAFNAAGDSWSRGQGAGAPMPLTDKELPDIYANQVSFKIRNKDGDEQDVIDGENIEVSDANVNMLLTFDFKDSNTLKENGITSTDRYKLPIPTGVSLTAESLASLNEKEIKSGEIKLGILHVVGSDIYFQFDLGVLDYNDPSVSFDGILSLNKNDANGEGQVELNLGTGLTVHIKVPDFVAKGPSVSKNVGGKTTNITVDKDGTVTWTVVYTPAEEKYEESKKVTKIVDTLPAGMEYVASSVSGLAVDNVNVSGSTMTMDVTGITEATTISYKTKITDAEFKNILESDTLHTFKNGIKTYHGDTELEPKAEVTAKAKGTKETALKKSMTKFDAANKTVSWQIVVDPMGAVFTKLELKDELGAYFYNLTNLKVNGAGVTPTNNTVKTDTTSPVAGSFTVDLSSKTINSNGQYVITYDTKLNEKYFSDNPLDNTNVTNNASLDWAINSTDGTTLTSAKTIGSSDIPTDFIKKEATGSAQVVNGGLVYSYKITVNPNALPLTGNVKVEDILSGVYNSQAIEYYLYEVPTTNTSGADLTDITYYSDATKGGTTGGNSDFTQEQFKRFTAYVAGANNRAVVINVKVLVIDKRIVVAEHSNSIDIPNSVFLYEDDTERGNANAKHSYAHNPLVKQVNSYNPTTRELTWRISLNQNSPGMINRTVEVTDTLPQGATYVTAKLTASRKSGVEDKKTIEEVLSPTSNVGQVVTWNVTLGNEDRRYDIYCTAKLNFDNAAKASSNFVFTNTVKAKVDGVDWPDKTAVARFPEPNVIDKNYTLVSGSNEIQYTVSLNPLAVSIQDVDYLTLEDELSANLVLDIDSVELYKAKTVYKGGALTEAGTVTVPGLKLEPDGSPIAPQSKTYVGNKLTVVLPKSDDGTTSYILKYSAYATGPGALENNVKLTGSQEAYNNQQSNKVYNFSARAFGSLSNRKIPEGKSALDVKKVDSDGDLISFVTTVGGVETTTEADQAKAAKFKVFKSETGTEQIGDEFVCNGAAIFTFDTTDIVGLDSIWLEETKAPEGYKKVEGRIEIKVADLSKGIEVINLLESENKKASLLVKKVDQDGNPLAGAWVSLYEDENCENLKERHEVDVTSGYEFTDLEMGKFYWLKETTTPKGYQTAKVRKILAGTQDEISLENEKITVTIKKVDEFGAYVENAAFTIYTNPGLTEVAKGKYGGADTENWLQDMYVPDTGLVIEGLSTGTYYIKETIVPDGYEEAEVRTIVIDTEHTEFVVDILNVKTASLTVKKVDQDNNPLAGAWVSLYGNLDCTDLIAGPIEIDKTVGCTFTGLKVGRQYYLKETTTPYGYMTADVVPVLAGTDNEVTLMNKKIKVNIKKVDSTGNFVSKAEFTIYKDSGLTIIAEGLFGGAITPVQLKDMEVLSSAGLDIEGLSAGTYYIEETKVPDGYEKAPVKEITIDAAHTTIEVEIENRLLLTVKKVDENGNFLAGAGATLYTDPACSPGTEFGPEQKITSSTGVTFAGLTKNKYYYLKETTTPYGYMTADVVPVLAGTKNEVTLMNKKITVNIKKVDGKGNYVSGAEFTIYKDPSLSTIAEGLFGGATTPVQLKDMEVLSAAGLDIEGLSEGTYYLEETKVPNGYKKAQVKEITIDAAHTTIEVKVENTRKTPPAPKKEGGNTTDDSSTPETTAPPVKPTENKAVVQNGKIPQTGQLWWPVWVLGGCGILFLLFGFFWKPKKKEE